MKKKMNLLSIISLTLLTVNVCYSQIGLIESSACANYYTMHDPKKCRILVSGNTNSVAHNTKCAHNEIESHLCPFGKVEHACLQHRLKNGNVMKYVELFYYDRRFARNPTPYPNKKTYGEYECQRNDPIFQRKLTLDEIDRLIE